MFPIVTLFFMFYIVGAVVAREYGLPCIVGAINATKIFKTGLFKI